MLSHSTYHSSPIAVVPSASRNNETWLLGWKACTSQDHSLTRLKLALSRDRGTNVRTYIRDQSTGTIGIEYVVGPPAEKNKSVELG